MVIKQLECIGNGFVKLHETLAVAEYGTGGKLQQQLSLSPNSKLFFHGGVSANVPQQLHRTMNISPSDIAINEAVTLDVAKKMALYVSAFFDSEWGIGITAFHTPTLSRKMGELYANYAVCRNNKFVIVNKIQPQFGNTDRIQTHYTEIVLKHIQFFIASGMKVEEHMVHQVF